MCRKEGLGLAPWGVIGQGKWQSKAQLEERKKSGEKLRGEISEQDEKMSDTLARVADEIGDGATVTSVAIAWALLKYPYVFPISESSLRDRLEHLGSRLIVSWRSQDQSPDRQHQRHLSRSHRQADPGFGVGLPLQTALPDVALRGRPS